MVKLNIDIRKSPSNRWAFLLNLPRSTYITPRKALILLHSTIPVEATKYKTRKTLLDAGFCFKRPTVNDYTYFTISIKVHFIPLYSIVFSKFTYIIFNRYLHMNTIRVYAQLSTDQPNKRKEHQVHIYILLNTKLVKRVETGVFLLPKHWDKDMRQIKPTYAHAASLTVTIERKLDSVKAKMYPLQNQDEVTAEMIRDELKGQKATSVLKFFEDYIEFISVPRKGGTKYSTNTIKKWKREKNRLKSYQPDVSFNQITVSWLEDYEAHCAASLTKDTSLPVTMNLLNQILLKADKKGLIDIKSVSGYKRPMYRHPSRPYLTLEQTEKIAEMIYSKELRYDHSLEKTAAFFLIECYSGIRFSDWGKFTIEKIIDNNGLKVRTTKTGADIYLRLDKSPRLQKVVDFIRDNKLVFDLTEQYANRLLKHIGGKLDLPFKLTSHVGRHTFSVLTLNMGFSYEYLSEVLGVSMNTAQIYGKITRVKLHKEYEEKGGL